MESQYFFRVMVGIVGLLVHIYFEVRLISGVRVGLTHTVSKMLLCTLLGVGGFFFGWGVGIFSNMWTYIV